MHDEKSVAARLKECKKGSYPGAPLEEAYEVSVGEMPDGPLYPDCIVGPWFWLERLQEVHGKW